MKRIILIFGAVMLVTVGAFAQPRPVDRTAAPSVVRAAAPATFAAKYDGGMFGFGEKEMGTLTFDDANQRLVFSGKNKKEKFGIPYKSLMVISPESRSVSSTTGTVLSQVPLPGAGLAGLMRKKKRYLVVNFSDPDADARGVINFKLENKELLDSVIRSLGEKAKMTQRGDAYYRPRTPRSDI